MSAWPRLRPPRFLGRRAKLARLRSKPVGAGRWVFLFFCHIEQCGEDFGRSLNTYEAANKVTCARFPLFSRKTILYDRTPERVSDNVKFKSGNEICRALASSLQSWAKAPELTSKRPFAVRGTGDDRTLHPHGTASLSFVVARKKTTTAEQGGGSGCVERSSEGKGP